MLKNYLWEMFLCVKEEYNDGDNFNPDMSSAAHIFVAGVTGNPDHQYKCLSDLDTTSIKKQWEAMDAESQCDEYNSVGAFFNEHSEELCAAFTAGDREKFMTIVNG